MNTAKLKVFAQQARNKLLEGVARKIEFWGFDATGQVVQEPVAVQGGYTFRGSIYDDPTVPVKWRALKSAVNRKKIKEVVEEAAYTWFNRMMAIRILSRNGYETSQLEYAEGAQHIPLMLQRARRGQYDFLDATEKTRLQPLLTDFTKDVEAFALLLTGYCHHHPLISSVFGNLDDFTELLLPDNILSESGFLHLLNNSAAITDDDYQQVELIGWLYQFYISKKKDEVFASFKKNNKAEAADIPAATQIFTPNWIVKYMVQNTVGKLWLDMKPDSPVKEQLKYLVENAGDRRSNPINSEAADIKLLDPACGSGHILVEGFELLYQLFMEELYTPQEAVETILSHCLYGLDIDRRAMQLSRFAVLLKAAKEYPDILRNPVMPHVYSMPEPDYFSRQEVLDFLGERAAHEEVLSQALKLMRDAQNLGSIMKFELEEEAVAAIAQRLEELKGTDMLSFNEQVLLPRIQTYLEVLLVLTQKYEAVVANPPYMGQGTMNASLKNYVNLNYPVSKSDLFAVFMQVCLALNEKNGLMGMINQHSWMFLSSYEKLREEIIGQYSILNMLHLGPRTFEELSGEVVQSTAFVIENTDPKALEIGPSGTYFRLVDYKSTGDKHKKFLGRANRHPNIFQNNFSKIPGSPIAYWVSGQLIKAFEIGESISKYVNTFQGIITGNNDKFLRYWQEVSCSKIPFHANDINKIDLNEQYWIPYNKGGTFRKWYGVQDYVVFWRNGPDDKTRGKKQFERFYLKEYISWSYTVSNTIATRYYPFGFLWDVRGSGLMDKGQINCYLQGLIGSIIGIALFRVNNSTLSCQVENIQQLPIIVDNVKRLEVEDLVTSCILISRADWDSFEVSWDFEQSPQLNKVQSLEEAYQTWQESVTQDFFKLHTNEEALNRIFIEIYGLQEELTPEVALKDITILQEELDRGQLEADESTLRERGLGILRKDQGLPLVPEGYSLPIKRETVMTQFVSYAVGCFMGRYRLDKPGLNIAHPHPSDEELLTYVVQARDGKSSYPFEIEEDAILPMMGKACNFTNDVLLRMQKFVEVVWGPGTYTANMNFLEECLDMDLEKYLVNKFWDDHKKTYKKKPIYWLFTSANGAFQVLVYMHRMNRFTVEKIRSEYLLLHLKHLQSQIDLLSGSGQNPKLLDRLRKDQMECEEYDLLLKDMADRQIEFDLDDGVSENYKLFEGVVGFI